MNKNRKERLVQIRRLGLSLLGLAACASGYAYFFATAEQESYYMMSAVFGLMSFFCITQIK